MEYLSEERTKVLLAQVSKVFESHVVDIESPLGFPQLARGAWKSISDKLTLTRFPSIRRDDPIPFSRPKESELSKSPLVEINEDYKSLLISDLFKLEVNSLYPSVIFRYAQSGAIADDAIVRIFCWLWSNRTVLKTQYLSNEAYMVLKMWLNYFYGMIPKLEIEGVSFTQEAVATKAKQIMEGFLRQTEEWYHVDTVELFFYHSDLREYEKRIKAFGLSYEITRIESAIFFAKKKYVTGRIDKSAGFKHK